MLHFTTARNPATYAASSLCQHIWADISFYPSDFSAYCREIYVENGQNLLFNAQLEDPVTEAWEGEFFFAQEYLSQLLRDVEDGHPAPSVALMGKTLQVHYGIFQYLCLRPETQIRFSGWFRVESEESFEARILYIGWGQTDGQHANEGRIVYDDLEWTYVEREFTLPANGLSYVEFYPAHISGRGTLWFDDVRLEIVAEPVGPPSVERIC